MNLNIENWKEFKIKDIFRLEPTKGVDSTELLEGNVINYIGAKHEDNGLMLRCQLEGFESWVSKGNCIVFIQLGAGSAGYVNYIPDDFIGMNGKTICGYIDGIMNSQIGLFLETVLCKERPKYSFGRSWTGDRLRETIIKLPADLQGNPDWKFMEDYIKSLNHKPITTNNRRYESHTLETTDWKDYIIEDLFDVYTGGDLIISETEEGDYPVASNSSENNNIAFYSTYLANRKLFNHSMSISIADRGVFKAFAQPKDFYIGTRAKCLVSKNTNITILQLLFIVTIINQEAYRYSYGYNCCAHLNNMKIKLPTKNNQPDWEYMENYIKSLPYGDRI